MLQDLLQGDLAARDPAKSRMQGDLAWQLLIEKQWDLLGWTSNGKRDLCNPILGLQHASTNDAPVEMQQLILCHRIDRSQQKGP